MEALCARRLRSMSLPCLGIARSRMSTIGIARGRRTTFGCPEVRLNTSAQTVESVSIQRVRLRRWQGNRLGRSPDLPTQPPSQNRSPHRPSPSRECSCSGESQVNRTWGRPWETPSGRHPIVSLGTSPRRTQPISPITGGSRIWRFCTLQPPGMRGQAAACASGTRSAVSCPHVDGHHGSELRKGEYGTRGVCEDVVLFGNMLVGHVGSHSAAVERTVHDSEHATCSK